MSRVKDSEMVMFHDHRVSPLQYSFLKAFVDTGDVKAACNLSGMRNNKLKMTLQGSKTPFVQAFREVMNNVSNDFNYSKVKNLYELASIRDRLMEIANKKLEGGDADLRNATSAMTGALKAMQEMNKMVDGNLAAQKKVNENIDITVEGVIDMTPDRDRIGSGGVSEVIDIEHNDLGDVEEGIG